VEKVAYALLGFVAVVWILGMIAGMVAAWPFGFFGLSRLSLWVYC